MEKKLKIALIIVTIIAILEFLVIINNGDKIVQTDSDTTIGYFESNSNINGSNNTAKNLTSDEIKNNIQVEYAGIALNGDFILKVTNNNESTVIIDSIDIVFKNEKNVFTEKVQTYNSWFGIQSNKTIYVYASGYNKEFSKYPNYEFNINLATSYVLENITVDNFEVTANNSGEQIAVEVKNNNEVSVEHVNINAVYFKDGNVVGIVSGSDILSNATSSQGTTYINVEYPKDNNYNEVLFDNYEVYFISADIVE